jgi:cephalosporin hydroxylase
MPQQQLLDPTEESLRALSFDSIVKMPLLLQQRASLTPMEKAQVGLIIIALQTRVIVETGVWRGRTTRFISEMMTCNGDDSKIYGFDFPEVINEIYEIDPFFQSVGNVEFVRGTLPDSMRDWLGQHPGLMIDFALVDATHSYTAVYDELTLIAPRLSSDGYIFCHDYDVDEKSHVGVTVAIADFCHNHDFAVVPLHSRPPAPKRDTSWQSALLLRKLKITWSERLIHWRADARERYPVLTRFWRKLRGITSELFGMPLGR